MSESEDASRHNNNLEILKKTFIWLFIAVVFIIIFKDIATDWSALNISYTDIKLKNIALSYVLLLLHFYISFLLWHLLTIHTSCSIPFTSSITAWFYSLLGKYIPGKIFMWAGRMFYYKRENADIKQTTFCFIFEMILQFLASILVIIIAYSSIEEILKSSGFINLWPVLLIVLFLTQPRVLEKSANFLLTVLKKEKIIIDLSWKMIFILFSGYLCNALLLGASFYLLANAFYPLADGKYLFMTGSFLLASWAGILSLFAPAGLGVRDGILLFALRLITPDVFAATIVISARLWTTAAELSWFGAIYGWNFLRDKNK